MTDFCVPNDVNISTVVPPLNHTTVSVEPEAYFQGIPLTMTEPTAEYPSPEELQALVAHGDYYHALHLLGCPGFTPGDGSWTEWILLQMYRHRTHDSTTFDPVDPVDPVNSKVDTAPAYLQLVAKLFPLPMDHHDRSWRCYYDLCAYFQQPVQPFQFYTTFLSVPPNQLALSMTRRSDLHGLDILLSYFPMGCTVLLMEIPPTLAAKHYIHLIPWEADAAHLQDFIKDHIRERFQQTGRIMDWVEVIKEELGIESDLYHDITKEYQQILTLPIQEELLIQLQPVKDLEEGVVQTVPAKVPVGMPASLPTTQPDSSDPAYHSFEINRVATTPKVPPTVATIQESSPEKVEPSETPTLISTSISTLTHPLDKEHPLPQQPPNVMKQLPDKVQLSTYREPKQTGDDTRVHELEQEIARLRNESNEKDHRIQQLQDKVQAMQQDHALHKTADQARMDYLLVTFSNKKPTPWEGNETKTNSLDNELQQLAYALEVSELQRAKALEDLQEQQEFYADKMKHLQEAFRRMIHAEEQSSTPIRFGSKPL